MKKPWQTLQKTGIQTTDYPDFLRTEVYPLFKAPPRRVLDVGCAAGAVGVGIKNNFPESYICGCELDLNAAKIAATRLDKVIIKDYALWSDEENQAVQQIDTILFLDVLEHMYNPWGALKFFSSHLTPGGQIIVSLPNIQNANILRDLANGHWNYKSFGILDVTHIRFFTEYEMTKMFYEVGLRIVKRIYMATGNLAKNDSYPIWANMGNINIVVQNEEHWAQLHAIQIGFCLELAEDAVLTKDELALRYDEHPHTYT